MKRKGLITLFGALLPLCGCILTGCKKPNEKYETSNLVDISVDGELQKTSYYTYEPKWDLKGIQIRFEYEDGSTSYENILDMENVTYKCSPSNPRLGKSGSIILTLKDITYTYVNGETKDLGSKTYSVYVTKLEEKEQKKLTTINSIILISVMGITMALVIVFNMRKKRK